MKLAEMAVLLTGATGGIGRATALALSRAGARLVLNARSSDALEELAHELHSGSGRVTTVAGDITVADDRARLAAAAGARDVNVLINNAATPCFGMFEGQTEADIAAVLLTNLVAPLQLTHALLPHLRRQPEARVLNIGSALGRLGLPGYAIYSASKFGLRGFSEALRRELAGSSVRVQYLGPRSTRTGFNDRRVDAYNRATGSRADSPEQVAHVALALLQGRAAERFIGFPESLAVRLNGIVPGWLDGDSDNPAGRDADRRCHCRRRRARCRQTAA